jgi:hypothetical protein
LSNDLDIERHHESTGNAIFGALVVAFNDIFICLSLLQAETEN